MHIADKIKNGKFVFTCEVSPPKGVNIQGFMNAVDMVKNYVDAIVVTDNQRAVMRAAPLALCQVLKAKGVEPVMELCTRDRNRVCLQSELLGAAILGTENVLISMGHDISVGDHLGAKPVHDLDLASLVGAAMELTKGRDMAGHSLEGAPNLCIGVEVTVSAKPSAEQVQSVKDQVSKGAQFIVTQPIYEPEVLHAFMEAINGLNVPVIAGHMFLRSASMARFVNSNLPGVSVPDDIISKLDGVDREELPAKSQQLSIELVQKLRKVCNGVHLMPGGWERYVPRLVDTVLG